MSAPPRKPGNRTCRSRNHLQRRKGRAGPRGSVQTRPLRAPRQRARRPLREPSEPRSLASCTSSREVPPTGSLLNHIQLVGDDEADELGDALVKIHNIHPSAFFVLDSDQESEGEGLGKPYTRRFLEGIEETSRVWVTEGREVENYLRDEVLIWAAGLDAKPIPFCLDRDYGRFHEQIAYLVPEGDRAAHSPARGKVRFAREVVAFMLDRGDVDWLDMLDLREEIERLREKTVESRKGADVT